MGVLFNGDSTSVRWYTTSGLKWQGFGKVFVYPKSKVYKFRVPEEFGRAVLVGSLEYILPLDKTNLSSLLRSYGSINTIESKLIAPLVRSSVYKARCLIEVKDSYEERDSLWDVPIETVIHSSVYEPLPKETGVIDQVTGTDRVVHTFDIRVDDSLIIHQEDPSLEAYGVTVANFSIKELPTSFTDEF